MSSLQQQVSTNLEKYRAERSRFIELIRKQEALAAQDPDGYRRKVVMYAWLGYGYVIGILVLLLAILAGIVYLLFFTSGGKTALIKVGIIVIPVIYIVFRSLFVKMGKPEGPTVTREEAPRLWAEVDDLTAKLGAPKVDEIIFEMDMNAAAAQVPRFGLLGFYKNYLLLGLPLMMALSKDEMKSVMAHEFGHFSGQHGKTGGWIYRLNVTFGQIRESLSHQGGAFLFSTFFNWFQPRFDALSFALRRQNEYAADAATAQAAGAKAAASALIRLDYMAAAMEKGVWDVLSDRVKVEPQAPADAYADLEKRINESVERIDAVGIMRRAFARKTTYDDTHPSLTDRLRAAGQLPEEPIDHVEPREGESAAAYYLGPTAQKILAIFNREFHERWAENWPQMHADHQQEVKDLADLEVKQETTPLDPKEQLELAFLTLRLKEATQALPMFQRLHGVRPREPEVLYGLGEALLKLGDKAGEDHLRECARLNLEYLPATTRLIAEFRAEHGDPDELEALREEYYEKMQVAQVVERQKFDLKVTDHFEASTYDEKERADLTALIAARKEIKRAWLVAKVIRLDVDQKRDILIIEPTGAILASAERNSKVVDAVIDAVTFPKATTVFAPEKIKPWAKAFESVRGSLIFERER